MHHIGQLPGGLCDVSFDCVGQRIHSGCGGQPLRHRGHHLRIDHGENRNIVRIDADKFPFLLLVGDNIVDRDLRGGSGRGRDGDDRNTRPGRGRAAFQRNHIGKLRIVDDDADRFRGVGRGASADRNEVVRSGRLERFHALLDNVYRGIGLHVAEDGVGKTRLIQQRGHFVRHMKFDEILVGHDKRFFEPASLNLVHDGGNGSRAEIGSLIQNHAIDHFYELLLPQYRCFVSLRKEPHPV